MASSGVRVRLQGYPGKPRRRVSPARSLGVVVLIVTAVGVTTVFRHLPRGAGEGKPAVAPADRSAVSKPQLRDSAPISPSPPVSTDLAVSAKSAAPAAPRSRPDGNVDRTGAPSTDTHSLKKAANSTATTGSASKVAPRASVPGDPPILHSGTRRYQVRVGAFADKLLAEELTTRLRALGYAVRIVGTQPFLVLVGGYLDEPTAGRLVSHLRGQGFDAVMNPANAPQ